MNKPKYVAPNSVGGYRAWKKKEDVEVKKEINMASFTEFPDLVKDAPKKTVFEGTSLASKLKEVIHAEEEAAIQKRLKKGDTPEMILREQCVVLPLKTKGPTEPLVVPEWVTDTSKPAMIAPFRHKSLDQLKNERKWKRMGVNPFDIMLHDEPEEQYIDDAVSLPSISDSMSIASEEEVMET
jgi:hypothetical protein